uniref:Fibrinogen C-terminal domain-containing protein n=1 Tax=Amphimedon queenslandica TaxID=400682 RepID=A0A1X7TKK8_AMPQE
MRFTTKDNDNDKSVSYNCAVNQNGAWWFNYCYQSNLNGPYYTNPNNSNGIIWYDWKGFNYSLRFTEMKTRRNN